MIIILYFFFYGDCSPLNLHVRTRSFPTRRSSDLKQMKFATLLAAVTFGSIAAPAMAQDRDPAEDFNGPYIAIGGGASLQSNDSGETLLFDTDGDGNYGDRKSTRLNSSH